MDSLMKGLSMLELEKNLDEIIDSFEKNIIAQTLKEAHGNQSRAAQILGITKRKIQYKIQKYGIDYMSFREHAHTEKTFILP